MSLPADFAQRIMRFNYQDASELMRIFRTPASLKPAPIYYGRNAKNRFDDPAGVFGVMYAAFDLSTCFAETITREVNRRPLKHGGIPVSASTDIQGRFVATLQATRPLKLVDATDVNLYSLGAEAGEFNSSNYAVTTHLWAQELFNRAEAVDGIYYRSRFLNNRLAVAIFERGGDNVSIMPNQIVPLNKHPAYRATLAELRISLLP